MISKVCNDTCKNDDKQQAWRYLSNPTINALDVIDAIETILVVVELINVSDKRRKSNFTVELVHDHLGMCIYIHTHTQEESVEKSLESSREPERSCRLNKSRKIFPTGCAAPALRIPGCDITFYSRGKQF